MCYRRGVPRVTGSVVLTLNLEIERVRILYPT